MSLRIRRVCFSDFRNYASFKLDDLSKLTILCGRNAVGKTNIVEGIQLLTALSSFRHPSVEQLVKHGAACARIEAEVTDDNRDLVVSCSIGDGKKRYALNGKGKQARSLCGLVPSVTFTPDDLDLVKGPMSGRRGAVDALGVQLSRNYYVVKRDYEQVLRFKNKLLKDEADDNLLESVNETLVTCGSALVCYRAALFDRIAPFLCSSYSSIAAHEERLSCRYVPSWNMVDETENLAQNAPSATDCTYEPLSLSREEARRALIAALLSRRAEERARKRAVVGPHADRVEFFIDDSDAGIYGSQGQQRSIVLAFKAAEVFAVEEVLGQKPILLLDDVMSELDEARRRALMRLIEGDVQTFITTTNLSYFDSDTLGDARVVNLPLDEGAL